MVGAFFHKYSVAPSGETTDRIQKKLGCEKMGQTSSITMPSMVDIVGCTPAEDEKVSCFFGLSVCDAFGMTKFVIMEMLLSSIIFQNNYGVIA